MLKKFVNKIKESFKKTKAEQRQGLANLLDNISAAALIGLVVGMNTGTLTLSETISLAILSAILIVNAFILRG